MGPETPPTNAIAVCDPAAAVGPVGVAATGCCGVREHAALAARTRMRAALVTVRIEHSYYGSGSGRPSS